MLSSGLDETGGGVHSWILRKLEICAATIYNHKLGKDSARVLQPPEAEARASWGQAL